MRRIVFLVHKGKEYTVQKYLASWGRELEGRIAIRNYPGLRSTGRTLFKRLEHTYRGWRLGTVSVPSEVSPDELVWIFTDVDRLDHRETARAEALFSELASHPRTVAMLNHPRRSWQRYELLQTLHDDGSNDFTVYRVSPTPHPREWPIFIRDEDDHGYMSALIHDQPALERELERRRNAGENMSGQIVVEFCDCRDPSDGVIRKYGAFRVGERLIARQIHFSRDWNIRVPDIKSTATAAEELAYVRENPHRDQLLEIFERAEIEYGRIDYSVKEGRIQVFEINTNPMVLIPADRQDELRFEAHDTFGRAFTDALRDLLEP